ncbi:MAG: argininosuccinate lyase [Actinomycetota bacterium]|nr:argininosuccinate lyase [Actinomycetota bacterium]
MSDDRPWGGRFASGPDPEMIELTTSLPTDIRLLQHDLDATKAHARALGAASILDDAEVSLIDKACDEIAITFGGDGSTALPTDEDVHSLVERLLTERLDDLGRRIHAGRSRNDLVATDLRLWCRSNADRLKTETAEAVTAFLDAAERHAEDPMPGYTHLQRAQPVTLGFHLVAHAFALTRDLERFEAARRSADVSVLGAGALATNSLGLDESVAAAELHFERVFDNALDAVSDRDFACDLLYACALCSVHLSRWAEEVVLWTTSEFGFARLDDAWSTGSSMMPQKRNPDLAELTRGRAAGSIADLGGLLMLLKGLPLAYNRDLQEDKSFLFSAVDRTHSSLRAAARLVPALRFDTARIEAAARASAMWATDLAELLVGRGVPFREAHESVGRLVAHLEEHRTGLDEIDPDRLRSFHPQLEPSDVKSIEPATSIAARAGKGAPGDLRRQIEKVRNLIRTR